MCKFQCVFFENLRCRGAYRSVVVTTPWPPFVTFAWRLASEIKPMTPVEPDELIQETDSTTLCTRSPGWLHFYATTAFAFYRVYENLLKLASFGVVFRLQWNRNWHLQRVLDSDSHRLPGETLCQSWISWVDATIFSIWVRYLIASGNDISQT